MTLTNITEVTKGNKFRMVGNKNRAIYTVKTVETFLGVIRINNKHNFFSNQTIAIY